MENFQKKLFSILIIVPLVLGVLGSCDNTYKKTGTLMDFVPENASVVFKIENFENLQADIENNSLLSQFEKTLPYTLFSKKAALLKNIHPSSSSILCINEINDILRAINVWRISCLSEKYLESRSQ